MMQYSTKKRNLLERGHLEECIEYIDVMCIRIWKKKKKITVSNVVLRAD